ncbi:hypothetical protein IFM58399_08611 [Aspergillus lentulus]|uniref:Uncharacterized protein n=1 Tax=Aspergillus lentulus TaxID=293939 RepID=A0ABQ1AZR5_ASPLE|nr:uncharacterized protein IFM58399_08611 [Aspergillus lentulus]GFF49647.1 hypothetical protein IFM58399_08611 [Aspergillus lentulus]GFF60991.1 hypothetical protein IFM62136_04861 [Aspergillus lentulus]GFF83219.1 hypothetical protein IFM47457_06065 [Aspergillus lentulus]GFF91060.1 hypothetical protein IFM60648_09279 [Aspergillus lentulus]GFF99958.1 hypothetical protein IFM61392_01124 [Aspergillus lentulus]
MKDRKVDSDTQVEVDTIILDYLLCTVINTFLCTQEREKRWHCKDQNTNWLIQTINSLALTLIHAETMSQDMRIKLQLLEFITTCNQDQYYRTTANNQSLPHGFGEQKEGTALSTDRQIYPPHLKPQAQRPHIDTNNDRTQPTLDIGPAIAYAFLSLCIVANDHLSDTNWADIAAQLMLKVASEKHGSHGSTTPDIFYELIAQAPEAVKERPEWQQVVDKYETYLQPPLGVHPSRDLETALKRLPTHQLGTIIIEFLFDLMRRLNPPVLLQLERGKLYGLSRAETQGLKTKIGLR